MISAHILMGIACIPIIFIPHIFGLVLGCLLVGYFFGYSFTMIALGE